MVVLAGHTRLEAARKLGFKTAPVHVAKGLTASQVRAFRIMDNRSGENAEWDKDLLNLELADLLEADFDLGLTGFTEDEVNALMSSLDAGTNPQESENEIPQTPEEPISRPGDLWLLGHHRLLCDDSTVATDVVVEPDVICAADAGLGEHDDGSGHAGIGAGHARGHLFFRPVRLLWGFGTNPCPVPELVPLHGIWASRSDSIGASPTLPEVTATARISSVSSSLPRWTLRQTLRFEPPCLRLCHSPSPSTLMPVLSTSRCNGRLKPRNGMTTSKVFRRRERVPKFGTAQPSPESSGRLATKPVAWRSGRPKRTLMVRQAESQRRSRPAGSHAALTPLFPTASRDRTRRSEIRAASAPGCTHASWWSCRSASAVCSGHSATILDSQSESQASLVQQGRIKTQSPR